MARKEFPEVYDALTGDFMERLAYEASAQYEEILLEALGDKMSPIEKLMAAALIFLLRSSEWFSDGERRNDYCYGYSPPQDFKKFSPVGPGITIFPECPVGKYRADFMVCFAGYRKAWVWGAIECDGHDHHDLTKEQAVRDRARDRAFQDAGVLILRYPGSEVWRQPLKCGADALAILERRVGEIKAGHWDGA